VLVQLLLLLLSKYYLREIGWGGVNFIDLAQDRVQWRALVNTVMHLWDS
jgi:hypothetical protein